MRSVLLPGTLCDARVFGSIAAQLADALPLDYRDHADATAAAAALLPLVPHGSLGIAFSLGGWVLMEMARMAPDRFTGLVLLSANLHPDDPAQADGRRARVAQGRDAGIAALVEADWPAPVGPAAAGNAAILALIRDMAEDCGHEVHARQASLNIARPDLRAALADLPVPVHLIAGDEDRLCPASRYRFMAEAGVTVHPLAGIGHFVPLEAPRAVIDVIGRHFPEAVR